jgi:protein TonB
MIGDSLNCAKFVRYVGPAYPEEARRRRIEGNVRLRVLIAKTGEIRDIQVLDGDPLLIPSALTAVRQWRYTPCALNSEPVEEDTVIAVGFNLNQ